MENNMGKNQLLQVLFNTGKFAFIRRIHTDVFKNLSVHSFSKLQKHTTGRYGLTSSVIDEQKIKIQNSINRPVVTIKSDFNQKVQDAIKNK